MKIQRMAAGLVLLAVLAGCGSAGEAEITPGIEPTVLVTSDSSGPQAYPTPPGDTPVDSGAYPGPQVGEPGGTAYPPADVPLSNQPFAPQPADSAFQRGEAFIEEKGVLVMESMPPQFTLSLAGTLPTPCHELRVAVQPPNAENQIEVEVYSVADPARMCTQVLEPFQASVPLQNLETGKYSVLVNGEQVGEIDVP